MRAIAGLLAFTLFSTASVTAQDKNAWKKTLQTNLEAMYPLTKLDNSLFSGRTSTKEEGIVLTVQADGMPFTDGTGLMSRIARVRDGKLTSTLARSGPGSYVSKVGDRVFIRDFEVDDDAVQVRMLTVEPIQQVVRGTTTQRRYYGLVRFEFEPTWLASADAQAVGNAISAILATDSQVSESKTIELGQTIAQVEKILGKPENIARLGNRTIYSYRAMKVIFVDGNVIDVQ